MNVHKATDHPKISVIINSHNEGPRLRSTVEAVRINLGQQPHEFVIVADEVTDGCADNLGHDVTVIRNERRIGCGQCKSKASAKYTGDVFLSLDAHQNVIAGSLAEMAGRAYEDDAIYVPVIRNIDYDEQWKATPVGKENHVPCIDGMRFETRQYALRSNEWVSQHHLQEIRMVGVGFAISRKTLERIGGFNAYRGEHGSQERGIALRAFMAGVPVKLDGSVLLGHEFRYDGKRKKKKQRPKGFKPYSARGQACNYWHAFFVVAGDEAFEKMRPTLRRKALYGESIVKVPHVNAERAVFQAKHKRRSDAELLAFLGIDPVVTQKEGQGLLMFADRPALNPEVVGRWERSCAWGAPLVQHPAEISAAYDEVKKLQPSVFVEVGSESGGSLYVYAGACAKGATIIAVDEGKGSRYVDRLERVIAALCAEGYDAKWVCGNSHDPETLHRVAMCVPVAQLVQHPGGSVDFLHIDGDHSKAGVLQDWNEYGRLVRAGGIVAMHDIRVKRLGVPAAWKSIVAEGMRHREFASGMINNHEEMGVGLIWKGVRKA